MMKTQSGRLLVIAAVAGLGTIGLIATATFGMAEDELASSGRAMEKGNGEGIVKDIVDVPGYTYVELETNEGNVWVAAPSVSVAVGDAVSFSTGMPMRDFYSKTLQREFPVLYFVDRFVSGAVY